MSGAPILVLGGTAEARELASGLDAAGARVITSLAGRVARPRLPPGEVRIGGFGGPEGLARWLRASEVVATIDATHSFAERISASAALACRRTAVPLLRVERPAWSERAGDRWRWADDLQQAASLVRALGSRVLLTTGRQGLEAFADIDDAWFLIRCVDPPAQRLPRHHRVVLDRGPYTLAGELALIDEHRIDLLVTKDSGGTHTRAKLDAARERGISAIVVRRPARPETPAVADAGEALAWALRIAQAG